MNTLLRELSQVWTLFHCCFMFMLLYESRYSTQKTNLLTSIFMMPLIALNIACVVFLGIEKTGQLLIFTCVLPSLLFFFLMAKKRDTRFLFTFCLVDTVVLEVLFATNLLDTALGFNNYIIMFLSRLFAFPLMEVGLVKYLRQPYQQIQQQMRKGWGVFSFLAAVFYMLLLLEAYHPYIILDRPEYIPHLVLLMILVPVMYITVFKVLWAQMKLFDAAEKNRTLIMQVKMATDRLAMGSENEKRLQLLRHDMKHNMLLLSDYLHSGRQAEAEKLISSLVADIDKNALQSYCDNRSVNVVLSYHSRIAAENGIQFTASVQLPEKLTVSETDFAVILSNGLENAVNALKECNDKKIFVKSFIDEDKIYLEIKNPFYNTVTFDGKIPRSNQENHGFGTKSMAAIVEKYGGVYSFTVEQGYFSFRCSI
ncbi:MAG: sensor histidine kinase [Clostridiaceae bacterium]|nr:sensor histidine kinase [Clostridiaceae bacterium]